MHHEKIASTFLKKCEEDKNCDKNKSILMYQGKKSSSFLKKCGKVSGNMNTQKISDFFKGNIHLLHCL